MRAVGIFKPEWSGSSIVNLDCYEVQGGLPHFRSRKRRAAVGDWSVIVFVPPWEEIVSGARCQLGALRSAVVSKA